MDSRETGAGEPCIRLAVDNHQMRVEDLASVRVSLEANPSSAGRPACRSASSHLRPIKILERTGRGGAALVLVAGAVDG